MVDSSNKFLEKDGEHRVRIYKCTIVNFNIAYLSHLVSEDRHVILFYVCSTRSFLWMSYDYYLLNYLLFFKKNSIYKLCSLILLYFLRAPQPFFHFYNNIRRDSFTQISCLIVNSVFFGISMIIDVLKSFINFLQLPFKSFSPNFVSNCFQNYNTYSDPVFFLYSVSVDVFFNF